MLFISQLIYTHHIYTTRGRHDSQTHNIFLNRGYGGYIAKIGDLGSAVKLEGAGPDAGPETGTRTGYATEEVGTAGYTAPEVHSPGRYSFPADVFSFAVLAWETTCEVPQTNPLAGLDLAQASKLVSLECVYIYVCVFLGL